MDFKTSEINVILKCLRFDAVDFSSIDDPLEYLSDCYNIETRGVELTGQWYKDAVGPYLAQLEDGRVVALLPSRGGFAYTDPDSERKVRINKRNAGRIKQDAVCFYSPFPSGKMSGKDFFACIFKAIPGWNISMMLLAALGVTVLGMMTPAVVKLIFSGIVPAGAYDLVFSAAVLLLSAAIASAAILVVKQLVLARICVSTTASVQASAIGRVLSMPANFFRKYSAGDIASRLSYVSTISDTALKTLFGSGIVGIFSLLYIIQIVNNAPQLLLPAIAVIALQLVISIFAIRYMIKRNSARVAEESKMGGFMLSLINGIQKIRLTGSENQMMTLWAKAYNKIVDLKYNLPKSILWFKSINTLIAAIGIIVMYIIASNRDIPYANFITFTSAYGMLCSGMNLFLSTIDVAAQVRPLLNALEPLFDYVPESAKGRELPGELSGDIRFEHVTFAYESDGENVIDDLSLHIKPGQYVGICGTAGCGKSTLMRLMLGFETPISGKVKYDGKYLDNLNLRALRRQIGCVMQNAQVMQGSILQNISIGNPGMTEDDAWVAAEAADIADDIRAMPMGMNTVVSHAGGGLSGGQRQRILIARALAGRPKILFMDEATSALDNIAQSRVSTSMDKLNCTRVCIAHRLSTIQNCDRILMLENGKIVEDGTYDELIALNNRFAKLVANQQL